MNVASDNKVGTSLGFRYDADNTVWVKGTYQDDGVAKTPMTVQVDENGYVFTDLADNTNRYMLGVPDKAYATGVEGWIQVGGPCDDVITPTLSVAVGHAFGITDGALVDVGADYSGATTNFAICRTAGTSATTYDMLLVPVVALAAT